MAKGFKHGGGGSNPMNFKVVGGTSAPSNPKENTIWIDTQEKVNGWLFSADNPNLLDFHAWMDSVSINNGTKTVSNGVLTLNSTAASCNTVSASTDKGKIPCVPGRTYTMEWEHTGANGNVVIFPNGTWNNAVAVHAYSKRVEYTPADGISFFTFQFGITNANSSSTLSNIRITEKERAFAPGAVWIPIGTSSPVAFSATKKNPIMVYPLSAKQYIGGAWVDKTAKSWQGGKWVDWITYLYNMGDECTDITGGWKHLATSGYASNAKNTAEGLYEKKTSNQGAYSSNWYTNNMIDVTDISVIHAKILATVAIDAFVRVIITRNNTDLQNEYLAWANVNYTNANELVQIDLDVSAFSGNYYIKLNHQGGSNAEVFWKEVWFE